MIENCVFRISDLERITGVNRRTIHYYLGKGLLRQPKRTGKTMAYYDDGHVKELQAIQGFRERGYPVALIKEMMSKKSGRGMERTGGGNNYDARRQEIKDKAVEVFAKVGYHKAKISDISKAAGLSPSSIYVYFPNKKALFLECVDQVFQSMFSDVVERIEREDEPLPRLKARMEVILKSHTQFIDILQVLKSIPKEDAHMESKMQEIYSLILYPVKKNLQWAIREGLLPPMNVDIVSYILAGLLETAQLLSEVDDQFNVDEYLDTVEKLVLR